MALSPVVYGEIAEVLARPKFQRRLCDDRRHEILELLSAGSAWFEPSQSVQESPDSKDNRYLGLALAADAAAVVLEHDWLKLTPL